MIHECYKTFNERLVGAFCERKNHACLSLQYIIHARAFLQKLAQIKKMFMPLKLRLTNKFCKLINFHKIYQLLAYKKLVKALNLVFFFVASHRQVLNIMTKKKNK